MRQILLGAAVVLLLFGCGRNEEFGASDAGGGVSEMSRSEPTAATYAAEEGAADAAGDGDADVATGGASSSDQPAPTLYLAYSHAMSLRLPSTQLSWVMDGHVEACLNAGPRLCQIVGANRSGDPESYLSGFVSLRAEPVWLRGFMSGVVVQTEDAGGRVLGQSTSTEDLTRAIVDTEAQLRAKTTLRDRLQQLLATRRGELAELLEVERALAQVQSEIDATQSRLAVMRTRVAMSELSISYESAPRSVGSDTLEPLRNAGASFLSFIVQGFAAIVVIIGVLIPYAIVAGLITWVVLAVLKRRAKRRMAEQEPPAAPPVAAPAAEAKEPGG